MKTFSGHVLLIGRPNAGKSVLLNACLKRKIAAVSHRAHTTRQPCVGVYYREKVLDNHTSVPQQIAFLDTPGIHLTQGLPDHHHPMNQKVWSLVSKADVICYLVDGTSPWHIYDEKFLGRVLEKTRSPVVVLFTKADKVTHKAFSQNHDQARLAVERLYGDKVSAMTALSAKRPDDVHRFLDHMCGLMPEGPLLYPKDFVAEDNHVVCELIREQMFRLFGQELPYETKISIDSFQQKPGCVKIMASLILKKENHKPIVIGVKGAKIKQIGILARESLERYLGKLVHLNLFVKVKGDVC